MAETDIEQLTIGQITMTGVDQNGVEWTLSNIKGWFDGWGASQSGVTNRDHQDGGYADPVYAAPRVVEIKGGMQADTWDQITKSWDLLLEGLPLSDLVPMPVFTGGGAVPEQFLSIRQHQIPLIERFDDTATFSLSVIAPDPRKYDMIEQSATLALPISSGGLSVPVTVPANVNASSAQSGGALVNAGNLTTYPILAVTGPCPSCSITNLTTGRSIRVLEAVPAGQTLLIDTRRRTASQSGQARRVIGAWWGLEPGSNSVIFQASGYDAAARLTVTWRSAWK